MVVCQAGIPYVVKLRNSAFPSRSDNKVRSSAKARSERCFVGYLKLHLEWDLEALVDVSAER